MSFYHFSYTPTDSLAIILCIQFNFYKVGYTHLMYKTYEPMTIDFVRIQLAI